MESRTSRFLRRAAGTTGRAAATRRARLRRHLRLPGWPLFWRALRQFAPALTARLVFTFVLRVAFRRHGVAAAVLLLLGGSPALATDYYLGSQAGNQPGTPVADITALNAVTLKPGDRVLFQGGQTFSGTIRLGAQDAGTVTQPVVLTSFGTGRATISAGTGSGIVIQNAGGITVSNLNLVGSDPTQNTGSGIDAGAYLPDSTKLEGLHFEQLAISGFKYGVQIWGWYSDSTVAWPGFRGVSLVGLEIFNNLSEGIRTWGTWTANGDGGAFSHSNFYISGCSVHDQKGDPSSPTDTGSGIVISGVDGAVVERCVVHDNGGLGPATGGGPFGILVWEARHCTVQYNLVYNQQSSSSSDGGAIDLDGGSADCVVQYNYAYHNAGPALALIEFDGASPLVRNTVRFNLSQDDCRASAQGAIYVGQFSSTRGLDSADIYGNTIYVSANGRGENPPAVVVEDQPQLTNVRLRNNLFDVAHSGPVVGGVLAKPGVALYQGNDYWGGAFDLGGFRGGGQETLGQQPVGMQVDPALLDAGGAPAITSPAGFSSLSAYQLQSGSPIASAGLDLTQFGLDPGTHDFYDQTLVTNAPPIGAAAPPIPEATRIRIVNLSVRGFAGPADQTMILGFVVGGAGSPTVLVRGVGPGLNAVGIADGTMTDPALTLYRGQNVVAQNNDWGGTDALRTQFAQLGAFALDAGSKDAALSLPLSTGAYTAQVTAASGGPGLALVELYDATKAGGARLVNVSARTQVGTGSNIVIAGFVLQGTGEKTLLIRGAGPSLAQFGLGADSLLADPQLTVFRGSTPIATNDDWSGSPMLKSAFATAGAFAFNNDDSADAAVVVTLGAGVYTAQVSGVNNTTGVALVEVYELP